MTFEHVWTTENEPTQLIIQDRIDVIWHADTGVPRVEIWGAEGVVDGVRCEVFSIQSDDVQTGELVDVLTIWDEGTCHGVRDLSLRPTVEIWHPGFSHVKAEGQGDFSMVDTLGLDYFLFEGENFSGDAQLLFVGDSIRVLQRAGVGNLVLAGSARWGALYLNGYGGLDARYCTLSTALMHQDGIGDLQINAPNYAFVALRNAGDCLVFGQPDQLDEDDQGAGKIVRMD